MKSWKHTAHPPQKLTINTSWLCFSGVYFANVKFCQPIAASLG